MDMLEQLLAAFDGLFEMPDEELQAAMPFVQEELNKAFMGPQIEEQVNEYFRQCDLLGYTLQQYSDDIENGREM